MDEIAISIQYCILFLVFLYTVLSCLAGHVQKFARRSSCLTRTTADTSTARSWEWSWGVWVRIPPSRSSWTWSTRSTRTVSVPCVNVNFLADHQQFSASSYCNYCLQCNYNDSSMRTQKVTCHNAHLLIHFKTEWLIDFANSLQPWLLPCDAIAGWVTVNVGPMRESVGDLWFGDFGGLIWENKGESEKDRLITPMAQTLAL